MSTKTILVICIFISGYLPTPVQAVTCSEVFNQAYTKENFPYAFAYWVRFNRLERKLSYERLSYEINLWGLPMSQNKLWRLEQNLVKDGDRPLKTIELDLIIALEGIFNKAFLPEHASFKNVSEFSREYYQKKLAVEAELQQDGPVQIAKWVQRRRKKLGYSLETLARHMYFSGYTISQNKLFRLEQNLVKDGSRPLRKVDYQLYLALEKVLGPRNPSGQ